MRQPVSLKSLARVATNANNSITRPKHSRAPSVFACRRNQILGEDFDGTNQIKTDWDVTSLCWTWWRSGRETPFQETGMFLDDGFLTAFLMAFC
jgi:hypothetical protein